MKKLYSHVDVSHNHLKEEPPSVGYGQRLGDSYIVAYKSRWEEYFSHANRNFDSAKIETIFETAKCVKIGKIYKSRFYYTPHIHLIYIW